MKNNKINVTMVGIGHAHAAGVLEELLTDVYKRQTLVLLPGLKNGCVYYFVRCTEK